MYYQEITLLPDSEISPHFIWQKLYTQLHIALADVYKQHGINTIGVSFPDYRYELVGNKRVATLGKRLRVFAQSEQDLYTLNLAAWLARLSDYVHIKRISEVGNKAKSYVVVKRYRYKHPLIKAMEYAKYKGINVVTALQTLPKDYAQGKQDIPFVYIHSESTQRNGKKHQFRLSIWQEQTNQPRNGVFNRYGLSQDGTTVPHW